jgi:zinc/manganese transport system substrate-binding protein
LQAALNAHVSNPLPRPRRLASTALALAFGLLAIIAASAASPGPTPRNRPVVLTSFLPIHSLAVAIAGDHAQVQNWLPQGVDPHDFQFSPRDLRRLRAASILVVGGLGLEGWSETKLRQLSGNPGLQIVEAAAGLPKEALILEPCGHDHDHEDTPHSHADIPNPHFWLDPLLMAHAATNIARAFQQLDPGNAEAYQRNAAATTESLHTLHRDYSQRLSQASTAFITYHAAFPYLARRYGLRLAGVVEAGPTDQPSARQLSELGRLVRSEKVKVLFMDGEPPRLARQIASDLNLQLNSLETLETGEFGPKAYENGMRRNLETLSKALTAAPQP